MKKHLLLIVLLLSTGFSFAQTAFTTGNLVICRIGDGSTGLVNTGSPVFLDEYTTSGTLVQSVAMPTTVSGSNKQLIASGTASSEGFITRSENGLFLTITGYARDLGGSGSLAGTTSAAVNRTIGIIDNTSVPNTSTALSDYATGNNPRSAVTSDGTKIWLTGGAGGVRYTTIGSSTSTQLSTTVTNLRQLQIAGNQLYESNSSGSNGRIGTVGTGLPETSGQTISGVPGFATTGSPYGFALLDMNPGVAGVDVMYVADDAAGITKYSLVGGNWTSNGTVGVAADAYRGLAVSLNAGVANIYATTKGGTGATGGGELVFIADASGYNAAFVGSPVSLVIAGNNKAFRGIAFAPTSPVLPLKFVSFSAERKNNDISLRWHTATEEQVKDYSIQKSNDGRNYTAIGMVSAINNYRGADYNYVDMMASGNDVSYYRIKATDISGKTSYSVVVPVRNKENAGLKIYPVTQTGSFMINYGKATGMSSALIIYSSEGKIVNKKELAPGTISETIDLNLLAAGTYYAVVRQKDGSYSSCVFLR